MNRFARLRYAYRFIRFMAKERPHLFEGTKSAEVAKSYGIEASLVKKIKARFRCELSFGEGK